jgi:hypothetical protein
MGASLAYLKEPIKDIEQETGSNKLLEFATGSMQGWRLNMVSQSYSNTLIGGFPSGQLKVLG